MEIDPGFGDGMRALFIAAALLAFVSASFAIGIEFYYGQGCPHCASTGQVFLSLAEEYNLSITSHEIYYDAAERTAFMAEYERFGQDINTGGVPTTIIDGSTMIIGGMAESQWRALFVACAMGSCPPGAHTHYTLDVGAGNGTQAQVPAESQVPLTDPVEEKNGSGTLTLSVIIGAALVDSINPCTIAVMVLLLGAILRSRGRGEALSSGLVFSAVIFTMYMLYGLGIMKAITSLGLSTAFYAAVTTGALVLAVMELNAYFNYKPGFLAVEMPMFLRPYAKRVTEGAVSPPGAAIAAVLCSLFLLPCSSGPYLVVLGMLAKAATLQTAGYLVLYNLFFVLPMILITAAIYLGKITVEQLGDAKERYIRHVHLGSGIILLALFVLMLLQLTGLL